MSGEKKFSFTPILSYPALQGAGAGSPCRLTYVPSRHFPSTTERNKPAGETHTVRPVVFNEKDPVMHRDCPLDCKVYVGNLGNNGNKTELERSFGYYGPLRSVWVARNPPGFAFVEFEDPRDATDAVRELDGRTLCGCRVRVELSNGEKRSRTRGAPPPWSRRARDRDDYRRRSPPPRRRAVTMPPLTTL
ncbi:serine/arginine-rich splicing factor 3b isoform X2 [Plectropomus leopardus]|uniref:serine/arginine-rich splicing factor 3b isoform X2 n=1 Tax=Plectropomus leopardus TaxID=160734 RepID=UPI001C4C78A1|nr:serine/arginine-rich splicing factor 3b isoform X2 [Plectropomus leopardus]